MIRRPAGRPTCSSCLSQLCKMGADRINHRRLLADKEMARAMEHQAALLLGCLRLDKPHACRVTASQMASASVAAGFTSIVDLRATDPDTASEKEAAENAGLRYFNIPVTILPTDFQIAEFARIINDPKNAPLFIHSTSA